MGLTHLMANKIQKRRSRQKNGQFNSTGYATGPQAPNFFTPNSTKAKNLVQSPRKTSVNKTLPIDYQPINLPTDVASPMKNFDVQ